MAEMKAWMLAKLLWDPQLDDRKLVEAFLAGYYGPAAPFIREYRDQLRSGATEPKAFLPITLSPSGAGYLTFEFMTNAERLFDKAEAAVKDDSVLLSRVKVARLPVRYVWACRWQELQAVAEQTKIPFPGPRDFMANLETFAEICKANTITKYSEGGWVHKFVEALSALDRIASPPPAGLTEGTYIDLQSDHSLAGNPAFSVLSHDDLASDKAATRMPGNHLEWAYQQQLGVPEGRYTIYVSVRVEKTGNEGNAFSAGVYDLQAPKFVTQIEKTAEDISKTGYMTFKVGTEDLHNRSLLWVAPPNNPENVEAVWVDRFWLVKE